MQQTGRESEQVLVLHPNKVPSGLEWGLREVQGPKAPGKPMSLEFRRQRGSRFYKGWGLQTKDALASVFYGGQQCAFYVEYGSEEPHRHCNVLPYLSRDGKAPEHLCRSNWLNPPGVREPPWAEIKVWANNLFSEKHRGRLVSGVIKMDNAGKYHAYSEPYALFLRDCYNAVRLLVRLLERAADEGTIPTIAPHCLSDEVWSRVQAASGGDLGLHSDFLDIGLARLAAQVYNGRWFRTDDTGERIFRLVEWAPWSGDRRSAGSRRFR